MCSVVHSGVPKKEQFDFLSHYNNASLVESDLKLAGSASGLAVSIFLNYGFWYAICESTDLISVLMGRLGLFAEEFDGRFCNCHQLATAITHTEVALAGQVSPWPVEQAWWQPLRFASMGRKSFFCYKVFTKENHSFVPLVTLSIFSGEVVSRTVVGALVTQALRYQDKLTIQPLEYAYGEKLSLSLLTGVVVGSIISDTMKARASTRTKRKFACAASASLTGIISAIISLSALKPGDSDIVGVAVVAGAGAAFIGFSGTKAQDAVIIMAGAVSGVLPGAGRGVGTLAGLLAGVGVGVGVKIGVSIRVILSLLSLIPERSERNLPPGSQLDSRRLLRNLGIILVPALALALINGISSHAVYGIPLEESLMETVWNQWQKIYVPLGCLHALFKRQ